MALTKQSKNNFENMVLEVKASSCPLCHAKDARAFHRDQRRDYFRCLTCHLVFVPPEQFLSMDEEKSQYDQHQNSPQDMRYRKFLSRLFTPMHACLPPGSSGLDFGSGPGPTLSVMFEEAGHTVDLYDSFYVPDAAVFNKQYDFITTSETVEHLHDPEKELDRLWRCLKPGGRLGVMTKLALDQEAFARWHYKNELTHVCFFSRESFQWLANQWQAEVTFEGKDVMIFHKRKES